MPHLIWSTCASNPKLYLNTGWSYDVTIKACEEGYQLRISFEIMLVFFVISWLIWPYWVTSRGVRRAAQPPPPSHKCEIRFLAILIIVNKFLAIFPSRDNRFSSPNLQSDVFFKKFSRRRLADRLTSVVTGEIFAAVMKNYTVGKNVRCYPIDHTESMRHLICRGSWLFHHV